MLLTPHLVQIPARMLRGRTTKQVERSGHVSVRGAALPAPFPLRNICFGSKWWKVLSTLPSLTFARGCEFVYPILPWGVQVALPAVASQQGETCARDCRPVPGELVLQDMEIIQAKWEARLSYFQAETWVALPNWSMRERWDEKQTICMYHSSCSSGVVSQKCRFHRQKAGKGNVLHQNKNKNKTKINKSQVFLAFAVFLALGLTILMALKLFKVILFRFSSFILDSLLELSSGSIWPITFDKLT